MLRLVFVLISLQTGHFCGCQLVRILGLSQCDFRNRKYIYHVIYPIRFILLLFQTKNRIQLKNLTVRYNFVGNSIQ